MNLLMSLFFFVSSILLFPSEAYCYTLKDQDLTPYEFQRYVRPQLKSILQDYKSLILALGDGNNKDKGNINTFRDLVMHASQIQKNCSDFNSDNCINRLKTLHKMHQELLSGLEDSALFQVKKQVHQTSQNVDQQITSWKLKEELYQQVLHSFFKLDAILLELKLEEKITKKPIEVLNILESSYIMFNILLLSNTKEDFKENMHSFWLSFIRPIYKYILIQNNQNYFQNNITELNFRLNDINAYLTKRVSGVPKQAATMIKIIHNRWNNILKVTLRPIP